jgi:hypothetical protein
MSDKPFDDFADAIYTEMAGMDVQLDPDPLQFGPKRLNQKTALLRKYLSRLEAIFLDLSQQQARHKRKLRAAQFLLDQHRKDLFANDPHVRAGRAVSERTAIADGMLIAEVREVEEHQNAVEDLETILGLVKVKRIDLKDVQGRLRDQLKICQEEIGLGARWGSKSPKGFELQPGQGFATAEDMDAVDEAFLIVKDALPPETMLPISDEPDEEEDTEEETETLLKGAVSPVPFTPPPVTPPPAPSTVDQKKQADMDAFLSAPIHMPAAPAPSPFTSPSNANLVNTAIDLDDILNSF